MSTKHPPVQRQGRREREAVLFSSVDPEELDSDNTPSEAEVSKVEEKYEQFQYMSWLPDDDYAEGIDPDPTLRRKEQERLQVGVSIRLRLSSFRVPGYCCAKCLARHEHETTYCPEDYDTAKVLFRIRKRLMLAKRRKNKGAYTPCKPADIAAGFETIERG